MENDFLTELAAIKKLYDEEQVKNEKFNIFRALHKIHNEKFLHSRFISYLLSPTSKHGMEKAFLKKFFEHTMIENFDLNGDIDIYPNEKDKSEKYNIDILIINKTTRQTIIIENKIYAKDSNHKNNQEAEEDSQFDSSESGESKASYTAQLKTYFEKFKVDKKNYFDFKYDDTEANRKIRLVYLTLNRKDPSLKDQFEGYNLTLIDYRNEIRKWLEDCIKVEPIDSFLKETLQQYLNVTLQLTNDVDRAKSLQQLISDNIDIAWKEKDSRISEMDDFKHVKWHTVSDFWYKLTTELKKNIKVEIIEEISHEKITKQTHKEVIKRLDRKSYGIRIKFDEISLYITNDINKGLTFGLQNSITKDKDKDWFTIDENIKFSDFNNKPTFYLINKDNRTNLVNKTIEDLESFIAKNQTHCLKDLK